MSNHQNPNSQKNLCVHGYHSQKQFRRPIYLVKGFGVSNPSPRTTTRPVINAPRCAFLPTRRDPRPARPGVASSNALLYVFQTYPLDPTTPSSPLTCPQIPETPFLREQPVCCTLLCHNSPIFAHSFFLIVQAPRRVGVLRAFTCHQSSACARGGEE